MWAMRMDSRARWAALIAALLWLSAPHAEAQAPRVERLEIIETGFLSLEEADRNAAPNAVGGIVIRPKNMGFLPETPAVTARVGTSFGVRFVMVGEPYGADVKLRSVWKIPSPGITDPRSGKHYRESVSELTTQIGMAYLDAYGFNEPWEIVKGTWTQQIWQGGRKLLERQYTIR